MNFRSHPASRQKEGFELHHKASKRWVDLRTLFELVSDVASESETRFVFSECDQINLQCICIASQSSPVGSAQLLIWSSARAVWSVRRLSRVQHSSFVRGVQRNVSRDWHLKELCNLVTVLHLSCRVSVQYFVVDGEEVIWLLLSV